MKRTPNGKGGGRTSGVFDGNVSVPRHVSHVAVCSCQTVTEGTQLSASSTDRAGGAQMAYFQALARVKQPSPRLVLCYSLEKEDGKKFLPKNTKNIVLFF